MSVFARFGSKPIPRNEDSPILQNFDSDVDSDGKVFYVSKDVVSPSMAADYSVSERALVNAFGVPMHRNSRDIVDIEQSLIY